MSRTTIVPHHMLKKEQLAALTVLCSKWIARANASTSSSTIPDPPSGYTHFSLTRITPRQVISPSEQWTWNQSKRKVQTEVFGTVVTLQKYTPKRASHSNGTRASPSAMPSVPRYKLWIITVGTMMPVYFLWVERGVDRRPSVLPMLGVPALAPAESGIPGPGPSKNMPIENAGTQYQWHPPVPPQPAAETTSSPLPRVTRQSSIEPLDLYLGDPLTEMLRHRDIQPVARQAKRRASVDHVPQSPMLRLEPLMGDTIDTLAEWMASDTL